MKHYTKHQFDNRDAAQMYDYLESRIDAMKRRIMELEAENETLRWQQVQIENSDMPYAASA